MSINTNQAFVNFAEGSGSAGPAHNYTQQRRDDAGTLVPSGQVKQPNLTSADPLTTTWNDGGTIRSAHIETLTITTTAAQIANIATSNQGYRLENRGATDILVSTVNRAFVAADRDVRVLKAGTFWNVPLHEDPGTWWFRTASGTSTLLAVACAFTEGTLV